MRRVIVESPFAGKPDFKGFVVTEFERSVATLIETAANILYARAAVRDAILRGEAPIASHLLLTQPNILDDNVPEERTLGIDAGLAWREVADASVVYVDRGISGGMHYGMQRAEETGLTVETRVMPGDWSTDALISKEHVDQITHEEVMRMRTGGESIEETAVTSALMHARGWCFLQTGPTELEWRKFDRDGNLVAVEMDKTWAQETSEVTHRAESMLN